MHYWGNYCQAISVFKLGVFVVPKSGEIYCEAAMIFSNPTSGFYNLQISLKLLNLSLQLTPQYGDSFVQALRVALLLNKPTLVSQYKHLIQNVQPNYGFEWNWLSKRSKNRQ